MSLCWVLSGLYPLLDTNSPQKSYFVGSVPIKLQGVSFSKYYLLAKPLVRIKKSNKRLELKFRFPFCVPLLHNMFFSKLDLSFNTVYRFQVSFWVQDCNILHVINAFARIVARWIWCLGVHQCSLVLYSCFREFINFLEKHQWWGVINNLFNKYDCIR